MSTKKTPLIFNTADGQQLRINTISTYLKKTFGRKVVKLSIDGKFTCPNRDGSKGTGGCLFCSASGSGDMASGSGFCQINGRKRPTLHTFRATPTHTLRQISCAANFTRLWNTLMYPE